MKQTKPELPTYIHNNKVMKSEQYVHSGSVFINRIINQLQCITRHKGLKINFVKRVQIPC